MDRSEVLEEISFRDVVAAGHRLDQDNRIAHDYSWIHRAGLRRGWGEFRTKREQSSDFDLDQNPRN